MAVASHGNTPSDLSNQLGITPSEGCCTSLWNSGTADIGRWKERLIGVRLLIVVIATSFGATLATFGKWIAVKLGVA
jgi:hypothetical protein